MFKLLAITKTLFLFSAKKKDYLILVQHNQSKLYVLLRESHKKENEKI